MSERPWYKRYPVDFIHGTMGLSLEEKGAYSILLDLIFDRGGPIPDDARYIAGVCNCSLRKWTAIRDRLVMLGKIIVHDGRISNRRAEKEIKNAVKIARERSESGSKGGRNRAEKANAESNNSSLAEAEPKLAGAFQKLESELDIDPNGSNNLSHPSDAQSPSEKPSARKELERVLDSEHAGQVIEHRRRLRKPLTAPAAAKLAAKFSKWPDPNQAADEMLANGWQGFEAKWLEDRRPTLRLVDGTGPPSSRPLTPMEAIEARRRARAEQA